MKLLLIILDLLLTNCGTEESEPKDIIDQIAGTEEEPQPDAVIIQMCQEGVERAIDFSSDNTIYFQACLNFRPCTMLDGELVWTKNFYSEEQIQNYADQHCGE